MRKMIQAVLPDDYEFFWGSNGVEALEYMQTMDFDVVLLDLVMPVMDGFETLRQLAAIKNKTPVLLITGVSDPEKLEEAELLGSCDFVLKPFDPEFLAEKVAFVITHKGVQIQEGMGEHDGRFLDEGLKELEGEDTHAGGRKLEVRTFEEEPKRPAPPLVIAPVPSDDDFDQVGTELDESFGFFVVQQVSHPSRIYELTNTTVKVGRGSDCDLILNDDSASRLHCILKKRGSEVILRDCDSSNGTIINGHDIREEALKHDDFVRIGRYFLTYKTFNAEVMSEIDKYDNFHRHRPKLGKTDNTTQLMQPDLVENFIEKFSLEHQMQLVSMDYSEEVYTVHRDKFELGSEEMQSPDLKGGSGVFIEWKDGAHWLTRRRLKSKDVAVNGEPVRKAKLEPGDVIEVGDATFAYQYREDAHIPD